MSARHVPAFLTAGASEVRKAQIERDYAAIHRRARRANRPLFNSLSDGAA